jgi:signal transduction histidine kinase
MCLLQTLPLTWRRRAPLTVLLIVASAVTLPAWAGVLHLGLVGASSAAVLSVVICIYTASAYGDRMRSAVAGAIAAAGPAMFQLQIQPESWMLLGGAWLLGRVARRGRDLARDQERLQIDQERLRIARELHDVVANSVTVIAVQAGAGRLSFDADPSRARDALVSIESKSRQALTEMRKLLGVLRSATADGSEEAPHDSQPSLDRLDALIEEVARTGLDVELTTAGDRRTLSPALELSVYWIIQEALTNALNHVGRTTARVAIRYGAEDVEVEIVNDGPVSEPAPVGPPSGGHGILGMRERAAVFGGSLEAGPRPEGGFRVYARLPLEPHEP